MTSSFLVRQLSLDRVCVAFTLTGCLAVLADANREGRAPLQRSTAARDGKLLGKALTRQQCEDLTQKGYLVVDDFLSQQQVQEARQAIQSLDDKYQFRGGPNEEDQNVQSQTRTRDRVLINRTGALDLVRQSIGGFAKSLAANSHFQGFRNDSYQTSVLHMPAQMQVSICDGTTTNKSRQQEDDDDDDDGREKLVTSTHNFYHKHLDSAGANQLWELGVLGWLRSQHLRHRYITCIVYLNPDWKHGDGGCLRVFHYDEHNVANDDSSYTDIAPIAGRMIVFSSPTKVHAVLATHAQRYACAVWLALEDH